MLERSTIWRHEERGGTYAIPPGWRPVLLTVLTSTAGEAEVSNVVLDRPVDDGPGGSP